MAVALSAKKSFAEAFAMVMKAAAKRTSRFEHAGGLILCDFLEEALRTLDRFWTRTRLAEVDRDRDRGWDGDPNEDGLTMATRTTPKQTKGLDWPFWLGVCRMMLESNNNMSEMRVVSLVFSMWDVLTSTPERKEALCVGWLLSEEVFSRFFCHWCPIVRAYYMRLVCWRICRYEGRPDELDTEIFTLVSHRLKTLWSHYLWQKQTANAQGRLPPSTAPCHPAPGKRFMIVKTLVPVPQSGLLVGGGFDGFFDSSSTGSGAVDVFAGIRLNADGSVVSATSISQEPAPVSPATSSKKKWGFFGKVLSFTASPASGSGGSKLSSGPGGLAKRTWQDELDQARRDTAAAASKAAAAARDDQQQQQQQYFPGAFERAASPQTPPRPGRSKPPGTPGSDSGSSTGSAPLYDAVNNFIFRFTLGPQNQMGPAGGPPQNRALSRPRLPAPAQARVNARAAALQRGALNVGGLLADGGDKTITDQARSDSPSPVAPGLPLETRAYRGVAQTGLISEARNARPLSPAELAVEPASVLVRTPPNTDAPVVPGRRRSLKLSETPFRLFENNETTVQNVADELDESQPLATLLTGGIVESTPPAGFAVAGAVYIGRALAEWALVTAECNSFVDRRRNEGVHGLSEVEVPLLSIEGSAMRSRA